MERSNEPVSVRITRLNNMVLGKTSKSLIRREGLIDSLLVLYDECNNDTMKKDSNIAAFVEKFRSSVSEIRSMRVNISDFEVRKVIGRGHFGEVHLVKEKQTGDAYAMKTLRKSDTLGNKRVFFENERDVMATAVSPWITSLQYAFQDMQNLYLVMEFHPGGDLLALLDRFGGHLSEEFSRFYLAEITSALRSLHQMGYVHRDIKPDNILLDRCGHIKLADFGSSAKLSSAGVVQAEMPVGTPEYLAPEVLLAIETTEGKVKGPSGTSRSPKNQPLPSYGAECDYWSLGIVAYEMIFGKTPFRSEHLATTYQNIQLHKKHLKFPENFDISNDFKNMILGLITDVNTRFTYDHLITHPFFADVDWVSLRDIVPPHVPVVTGEDDTSNFFEYERMQPAPSIESFKSHKEFSGRNLPFVGFTYARDPSITSNLVGSIDPHLERKLDAKKKEIHGLLAKIHALEGTTGRGCGSLEKRAETAEQCLVLIEQDRSRLETELARSRSEQQSLRRALDLEMQETKNMEARAMELIKSAKEKWDRLYVKEHKEKDKKIEQLTDQLTALNTTNNNLMSKLHRRDKEQTQLRTEVSNLQELVKEYKDNMAKTRQSQRESVLDVQSRLNELASESQKQLSDLQDRFDAENKKFEQHKAQMERKRHELEKALDKSRLEVQCLNDQLTEKSNQLKNLERTRDTELTRKIQKGCTQCTMWRERVTTLESELNASVMSFEKHETTIAEREEEKNFALEKVCQEKTELEKLLQNFTFKEEENKEKLASLEKLMKSLEGSITMLEEENSKLRDQNSTLVKYKRRSSVGANIPNIASPRASTTTTVTTTTVVAAEAEASVEPMCNGKGDEENHLQLQLMEANISKLESQLDKAKEAAIIDRQAAQAARTDLWRKEKELADVKLDLRISEREVKTLKETVNKLKAEKEKLEEDIKKDRELKRADKERISQLARELEVIQVELKQDKASSSSLTETLASYKSELSTKDARIKALEVNLGAANKQVKLLELQVSKTDETCHELRDEKKRILQQLDETRLSLQRFEVNSNVLKETCTMLEEQLEDFERLTSTHEAKEARLQEECSKLHAEVEVAQNDLRLSKQALNEEKSFRAQAEVRVQILEAQIEESKAALAQAQAQSTEYKSLAERLTEQVNSSDEHTSQLEVSLHSAQRQVANLQAELVGLKEEVTTQLTRIHTLKETNMRLDQELVESVEEERALVERVERLQSTIAEMEACHAHRQVKSDATMQQQAKLIDYLQQKLEEQGRRKKTLTDKLFGKKDKENQMNSANIINAGIKELESQLLQERKKVQKLTEEIVRSSTHGPKVTSREKEIVLTKSPEPELLSPTAAKHLVLSPGSQDIKSQASLQRMHHNIPHRFEFKVIMRSSKCAACQDGLPFGRQAASCAECGIAAHHRCISLLPSTCGLPSGFARHFSQRWKKSRDGETIGNHNDSPCSAAVNMEGWMKLPTRGNMCWERRYVRLAGSELLIFSHEPTGNSAHMSPIERYPLCPADGIASVGSATQTEVAGTAKSDVPFIIKVEVTSCTTCWPGSSQYLMALCAADKEKWIEALKAAIRAGEAIKGNTTTDRSRRYCGQVMARLPQEVKLDISCIMHISNQVVLLGTEEGLFSYHLAKEKAKPVKIGGVESVYQMVVMSHHELVIMISGRNRDLRYCDYAQLKSCAEAAECTGAVLSTKPVFSTPTNTDVCFQVVATSEPKASGTTTDILCAASTKRLIILKWIASGGGSFQQLKVLETQEPCSCILLTPHSIIVGCNKFFEIDAQDFSVEDFLDVSDKSLSHLISLAKKTNSFPSAILNVTMNGGRSSPEYLVCFHEVGVFVDQYGRRSREEDIKWAHVPFAFAFNKPFLFIFHFASVEVLRLSSTSFTRNLNDSGSTINECVPSSLIELNSPQYLGDALSPGSVYASNIPANGVEVVRIEGALACPNELGYSCSSLETAPDNNRDEAAITEVREECEFSFTSSIVQSLDEGSDEETDDARSSSHQESDTQSSGQSEIQSRHVHFRKASSSTLHTAM